VKHVEVNLRVVLDAVEGDVTGEQVAEELRIYIEEDMGTMWVCEDTAAYDVRFASVSRVRRATPPEGAVAS
jgi:hypothetical protein